MPSGDAYPPDYRSAEVRTILSAVKAGDCVFVVGLSGSGKSNLLQYLADLPAESLPPGGASLQFAYVDCNRLADQTPSAFFNLIKTALNGEAPGTTDDLRALEDGFDLFFKAGDRKLCLLIDRFEALDAKVGESNLPALQANLRALRDRHKYRLSYVIASRRPPDPHSELAELFYANTLWLGPLAESDIRWNIARFAARRGLVWGEDQYALLAQVSGGYPSFLKAACEALALGAGPTFQGIAGHEAVQKRLEEFCADQPTEADLRRSGLAGHPLVKLRASGGQASKGESPLLTAKENLLLSYMRDHAGEVCEKDDLIRAVWQEDKVFLQGIRDDSLAQLVRRLREKIEPDPSEPVKILTVPGRGYRYIQ